MRDDVKQETDKEEMNKAKRTVIEGKRSWEVSAHRAKQQQNNNNKRSSKTGVQKLTPHVSRRHCLHSSGYGISVATPSVSSGA